MIENLRKVIVAVGILIFLSFYFIPFSLSRRGPAPDPETHGGTTILKPGGESATAPVPASTSSRIAQAESLRYKDAPKALALVDEILTKPQDSKERVGASALQPELIELCFHKYSSAKSYDDARKMLGRLVKEFPDSSRARTARSAWARSLGEQIRAAATARDTTQVEALFKEYRDGAYYVPWKNEQSGATISEAQALEEYTRYQLARWRALPPDQREQEAGVALAAEAFGALFDQNQGFQIYRGARDNSIIYGEELIALGRALALKQLAVPAYNAYSMAGLIQWTGDPKRTPDYKAQQEMRDQNERYAASLALTLAAQIQENPTNVLTALTPDAFLEAAIAQVQIDHNRTALLGLRVQMAADEYVASTVPLTQFQLAPVADDSLPYEEKTRLNELLHRASQQSYKLENQLRQQWFDNQLRDTNVNLWPRVPPQVLAEIERKIPPQTPLDRLETLKREQLQRLISEGKAAPPVESPANYEERRRVVLALDGVYKLAFQREESFRSLRTVLREGTDPAAYARIKDAVQRAIRLAQKQGKFEGLIELAGFYSGEFGDGFANDPFRKEFRQVLESSAAKFKSDDRMKYIFVQALLATVFANEEIGRQAQLETVRKAFEIVQSLPSANKERSLKLPSGITGYSTEAVNNSTEYHILAVYDGPESFAVLCNPYRKGSFAMKNGKYRIAVLTPIGKITPYRTERAASDEHTIADYYISHGSNNDGPFSRPSSSSASGSYTLLRSIDELPGVKLDPATGLIRKSL